MSEHTFLPILGQEVRERIDAARNRQALLTAAQHLVDRYGVASVTMDAVAAGAGVGKGTVFRRFGSRGGLMAALADQSESDWQASVIGGPPPLGPGAPAGERLHSFGQSRLEQNLRIGALIRAASNGAPIRSYAAYSFAATHLRYLLTQLDVAGDIALLATDLLAPLEVAILEQQIEVEGMSVSRIAAGWVDLADRIIAPRRS